MKPNSKAAIKIPGSLFDLGNWYHTPKPISKRKIERQYRNFQRIFAGGVMTMNGEFLEVPVRRRGKKLKGKIKILSDL